MYFAKRIYYLFLYSDVHLVYFWLIIYSLRCSAVVYYVATKTFSIDINRYYTPIYTITLQ